ncbi:hypothetical protein PVL29_017878 [Vitis rotundifolia]|uniref:Uncharacterized protein n=1 Tax=Vitis rotundifolia TaxID=103349 RepID=A0AA38Z439_VITRO|nr:hypothetical protein PVL29_017878 [Vitis rotundifolia]
MDTNDSLRSATSWHSMHAISQHYRRLWVSQGSNSFSVWIPGKCRKLKEREFIIQLR